MSSQNPETMQICTDIDATALLAEAVLIHRANSMGNADVYRALVAGRSVLVKTYRDRPLFIRLLFGRASLRNEYTVLRRLDGVPGIPRAYALAGKDTLLTEFIEAAAPIRGHRRLQPEHYPPKSFFTEFRALLQTVHDRGISHGDVRRMNLLRAADDRPHLIDFATAVSLEGRFRLLRRLLFRMFGRADDFAAAKMIHAYYPELLTDTERQRLECPPWYVRAGRFLRRRVYRNIIKQQRWKKRIAKIRQAVCPADRKGDSTEVSP